MSKFPELDKYNINAFDGHFKTHACHAMRDKKGEFRAVGGIFGLDLRYGLVQQIISTDFDIQKKNEMRAFKEKFNGPGKIIKPMICVVDKAYVDGGFWEKCKKMKSNGMYVLSLMKENQKPVSEEILDFDKNNPCNCGVDSYAKVIFKSGATFRKIVYTDPETHKEYTYLTTVEDVSPGLLAFLYYWRWKIEKVFDVFKNKLHEKKSWANGKYAMDIQSSMIAMTYNFLLYTQDITLGEFNIKEQKLDTKRKKGLEKRIEKAANIERFLHPLLLLPHKAFQMSQQYIRCFRENFEKRRPWRDCLPLFEKVMLAYL